MVVNSCICSRYSSTLVDSTGKTSSYVGRSSNVCRARVNLFIQRRKLKEDFHSITRGCMFCADIEYRQQEAPTSVNLGPPEPGVVLLQASGILYQYVQSWISAFETAVPLAAGPVPLGGCLGCPAHRQFPFLDAIPLGVRIFDASIMICWNRTNHFALSEIRLQTEVLHAGCLTRAARSSLCCRS